MESLVDKKLRKITVERLRELFEYYPEIGSLTRKVDAGKGRVGTILIGAHYGTSVWVDGGHVGFHVICFVIYHGYWPTYYVDHKDRDKANNTIDNLREATPTQNQYNKALANPHGHKGVTWRNRKNPWLAKIRVDGKRINLGSFATKEEAALAYEEACLKYHGEFACLEIA